MTSYRAEDLQVFHKAVAAADAIFALTSAPAFDRDSELRRQLRKSSGRIQAHLQEGSGQNTDRHYAHYVTTARGSSKEVKGHLRRARGYGYITEAQYKSHWEMFDEIAAMLTGLKKHLEREDRKPRG